MNLFFKSKGNVVKIPYNQHQDRKFSLEFLGASARFSSLEESADYIESGKYSQSLLMKGLFQFALKDPSYHDQLKEFIDSEANLEQVPDIENNPGI